MYEALFFMAIRDFKKAAELFLESIATFTTYVATYMWNTASQTNPPSHGCESALLLEV